MGAEWWAIDKDPHGSCVNPSTSDRRNESIRQLTKQGLLAGRYSIAHREHFLLRRRQHSSSFWRCIHLSQMCFSWSFFWPWSWRLLFVNIKCIGSFACCRCPVHFWLHKRKHPILFCTYTTKQLAPTVSKRLNKSAAHDIVFYLSFVPRIVSWISNTSTSTHAPA
jgi:hypothetical protein